MKTLAIFIVTLLVTLGLNAALMVAVARLFRAERATWLRAAAALVLPFVAYIAGLLLLLTVADPQVALVLCLLVIGGYGVLAVWSIRNFLILSWPKATGAFFTHLVAASTVSAGLGLLLRYNVAEAYKLPTNSMAPTLLGKHRLGECPHCQGDVILPGLSESEGYDSSHFTSVPQPGICLGCRQATEATPADLRVHAGDRIMVDKTTSYQRFDLVVYYPTPDAKELFVKRLVALPGETLELRSGALWVNGQALQYPPDMKGLKFEPAREGRYQEYSLAEGTTLTLGDDELFLLGDHSQGSFDSRYTGPVPTSAIVGVVTWIYWPLSRSRIVR